MTERLEAEIDAAAQRRTAMTAAEVAKRTTELEGVLDGLQPGEEALVGGQLTSREKDADAPITLYRVMKETIAKSFGRTTSRHKICLTLCLSL